MLLAFAILLHTGFPPPSPPAEKAAVRQDQARQSCSHDGTGDSWGTARDSVVETESFSAAHRFTECNLDTVGTRQQWDADQVV